MDYPILTYLSILVSITYVLTRWSNYPKCEIISGTVFSFIISLYISSVLILSIFTVAYFEIQPYAKSIGMEGKPSRDKVHLMYRSAMEWEARQYIPIKKINKIYERVNKQFNKEK